VQHLDIIRVFYLATDAQESCSKNIKIYIKTAPTCKILTTVTLASSNNTLPDGGN
jgi:hypothetical protein